MASNKWTQQTPLANNSMKVVLAERVYLAAADSVYADPAAKLNGVDTALLPSASPVGLWSDLGIVANSAVQLTYNKEVKYVETGIEKVRRGAYITGKTCQAQFTLEQFDMGVIEKISGLTKVALSPAIGSKIYIGQDDIVYGALLFLGTNKIDGKEYHVYNKKAAISFQIVQQDDARVLQVTADLLAFTPSGQTVDAYYTMYVLD